MPRSVWMLIGAVLTIATMATIVLAIAATLDIVPTEIYSLCRAITTVAWVGVFIVMAVQCIKAFIQRVIDELEARIKKMVFHMLAGALAQSSGTIHKEAIRNHLRPVKNNHTER